MAENVFNLIPRVERAQEKKSRYESKFRKTATVENDINKRGHKTMGVAKEDIPQPNDFLKKYTGDAKLPEKEKFTYPDEDRKRPSVPKPQDAPLHGLKTTKNFINQNAVENIISVPKRPAKNVVDTRKGAKYPLDPSGLEPVYCKKTEYGKVPEYLITRQEEIKQAQQEYDNYVAEMYKRGAMQQLSEEEREAIIMGLKSNWEDLHHQFQSLSVMVDTVPKKNRKELLESKMKQLEKDIELIEKHSAIYIAN